MRTEPAAHQGKDEGGRMKDEREKDPAPVLLPPSAFILFAGAAALFAAWLGWRLHKACD